MNFDKCRKGLGVSPPLELTAMLPISPLKIGLKGNGSSSNLWFLGVNLLLVSRRVFVAERFRMDG